MIAKLLATAALGLALAGCAAPEGPYPTPAGSLPGAAFVSDYVTVRVPEGASIQDAQAVARMMCRMESGFIRLEEVNDDLRTYNCIRIGPND
jgi:hypothetical protein